MKKRHCVMVGCYAFHTIDEAHRFLADGGKAGFIPPIWRFDRGFLVRVH